MYKNHRGAKAQTHDYIELKKKSTGNPKPKRRPIIRTEIIMFSKTDWDSGKRKEIFERASKEHFYISYKLAENSVAAKLEFYKPKKKGKPTKQNPPGTKDKRARAILERRIYEMAQGEMKRLLKTKPKEHVKFIIENKYGIKLDLE